MTTTALLARYLLGALFLVAGVGKLASSDRTRLALRAFGVPVRLTPTVAVALPAVELCTGGGLFVPPASPIAAVAALSLIAVFSAAMLVTLARGRRPDCNCFGATLGSPAVGSSPIGLRTLLRNAVLIGLAALALARAAPPSRVFDDLGSQRNLDWLLLAGLTTLSFLVVQLLGQNRRLVVRLASVEPHAAGRPEARHEPVAPPHGSVAPSFALRDVGGVAHSLTELVDASTAGVVVVFVDPGCGSCGGVITQLARERAGERTVAVLATGDAGSVAARFDRRDDVVVLQSDESIALAYGAGRVPSAVLVDGSGRIVSDVVTGDSAVLALLRGRRSFELVAG